MPHFADYELYLTDWTGNQVILLTGPEMLEFKWSLTLNGPGVYSCTLVAESGIQDYFRKHYGLKLMRDYGDGFYEEFYGFHLSKREWLQTAEVDEHYWESRGLGPEWLLDQPLIWPIKSNNPNYQFYDMWWAGGPADDVIKQMASESIGGGADEDRQFSSFVVEGNSGEGVWSCFEARFDRLLASMQDIAGDEYEADFRVVRTGAGFELRSYSPYFGTDRRRGTADPTIFSLELANMQNPEHMVDWREEVTYLIGGWQGTRAGQALYFAQDATAIAETPFSRREDFIDLQSLSQSDPIPDIMSNELYNRRKVETVSFELLQTDACLYGRDWNLGDLVTLDLWGYSYDMRITGVNGSIDGQNEETIVGIAELYGTGNIKPIYTIEPEVPVAGGVGVGGAAGSGEFWRTIDGGASWTLVQEEAPLAAVLSFVQAADGNLIAGADGGQFWRSVTVGLSWTLVDTLILDGARDMIRAANGNLCATMSDQICLSTDDGLSWASVKTFAGTSVTSRFFVKTSDDTIFVTVYVFALDLGEVWSSVTNGATWAKVADVAVGLDVIAAAPNDYLVAAYAYGWLALSIDAGATWNPAAGMEEVCTALLTLSTGAMLAGSISGKIYKSTDNGANWSLLSNIGTGPVRRIAEMNDGTLLAAVHESFHYSTDGGITWPEGTNPGDTCYTVMGVT